MKRVLLLNLLTLLALGVCFGETAAEKKRRLSSQTVLAKAAQNETEGIVNKSFEVKKQERSMFDGMTILGSTGQWTIVPANAFLARSAVLSRYVLEEAAGTYVQWAEFSRRNRGWLKSHEVTIETIKGEEPITDEQLESFLKSRKVVVATYKSSPVSVLPARPKTKE